MRIGIFLGILSVLALESGCKSRGSDESGLAASERGSEQGAYWEGAMKTLPLFDRLMADLALINESTLPHETKDLRKAIGRVRLLTDIHIFVLPVIGDKDDFPALRDGLDSGYEIVGAFKDLYETAAEKPATGFPDASFYDESELKTRRKDVLKWIRDFSGEKDLKKYRKMYAEPSKNKIILHGKSAMSKFIWGRLDSVPRAQDSENIVVRQLAVGQWKNAKADLSAALAQKDVLKIEREELFHDARKSLRAALQTTVDVGQIIPETGRARDITTTVNGIIGEFGAIHRIMDRRASYLRGGKKQKAEQAADEIVAAWTALRTKLRDSSIIDEISELQGFIIGT